VFSAWLARAYLAALGTVAIAGVALAWGWYLKRQLGVLHRRYRSGQRLCFVAGCLLLLDLIAGQFDVDCSRLQKRHLGF